MPDPSNVPDSAEIGDVPCAIGVVGTGVMGASLARNLTRSLGTPVAVFDLDQAKVDDLLARYPEADLRGFSNFEDFVDSLASPRVILTMVPAGRPVDAVIDSLQPLLDRGDIIIDGGNTHYSDTDRRFEQCKQNGIRFIGMGVSGGQQGALWGPSLMPGGDPSVWEVISPLLEPIAAKAEDGQPCVTLCGSGASGHFTKMVHNGIEYADLQLLAEAYGALRASGLDPLQIADAFESWNVGKTRSYLLECATEALRATDAETDGPLVDFVKDEAKGKGTGAWTVIAGAEYGVSVSVIAEALFARATSSARAERDFWVDRGEPVSGAMHMSVESIRMSYRAARLIAYQQGLALLRAASHENSWDINLAEVVRVWRAGCIIRAGFLDDLTDALRQNPEAPSFLAQAPFREQLAEAYESMRHVVSAAALGGVPMPATAAALNHQIMMMTDPLPTALVQLQRDYFGSHTYERTDRPGSYHVVWEEDGREIQA